jgi:hypothetical protein
MKVKQGEWKEDVSTGDGSHRRMEFAQR